MCGQQLLRSNGGLEVGIGYVAIPYGLVISSLGDLLLLVESSLHLQPRLGLFEGRARSGCLVTGNFFLFVARAVEKPGLRLARAVCLREDGLQAGLEFITSNLA